MKKLRFFLLAGVLWSLSTRLIFAAPSATPEPFFCLSTLPIVSWFVDNSKGCRWPLYRNDLTQFSENSYDELLPTSSPPVITDEVVDDQVTEVFVPRYSTYSAGTGISILNNQINNLGILSLEAGSGIGIDSNTITNNDTGSSQAIFKNIVVSDQANITAGSNNDTLTFVAGNNVSITTDATNKKLTISATSGSGPSVSGWSSSPGLLYSTTLTDSVSIGTTTALGKLGVAGTSDQHQLVVKGYSSQTQNLFSLQNSSGTSLASFNSNGVLSLPTNGLLVGGNQLVVNGGRVGIGTASPSVALDVNGSVKLAENQVITLSANTPTTGTISRLITLKATSQYDRPWISSLDTSGRHVAAMGIHGTNFTDSSIHNRWELKTVAAAAGSMPTTMITRLAIDYDKDLTDVIFSRLNSLGIHNNYGERISMVHQMRDAGDTGSYQIGEWSTELGAADSTVMAIDPKTLTSANDVTFRMFRETNTSGQRRFVIMRGDGTATETFVINAATGAVSIFNNGEAARLGDGTNVASYINFQSNRTMTGYDGSYAVIQGGTSKGVKFNVNSSSFGAGTVMTILPTGEVGIGTTNPAGLLSVGTGSPFQVNSSGGIMATGLTSSGAITLSGLNTAGGVVYTDASGVLGSVAGNAGQCLISNGTSAPSWSSCDSASNSLWVMNNGSLYPVNASADFIVGGNSSASAKFAVLNLNGGTAVASISGLLTINNSAGRIQATQYRTLNIGGNSTGTISLQPNNSNGRVGINTTSPLAELDIVNSSSPEFRLSKTADTYFKLENKTVGTQLADVALTGEALLDFDPITTDGVSKSSVRLFRNVTTTDPSTGFAIYSADGTSNIQSFFSAKENSYFNAIGGNFGIGTPSPTHLVHLNGGAYSDGTSWENASDRNQKTGYVDVDPQIILAKIDQLPISEWNYISQGSSVRHLGPVAQDFYTLFGLGGSDTSISTIDPAGVALVGIKGLNKKIDSLALGSPTQDKEFKTLSILEQIEAKGSFLAWGTTLFKDTVSFEKLATFMSDVVFKGRVIFEAPPTFNHDTAGAAIVHAGADQVKITFDQTYDDAPQVMATVQVLGASDTNSTKQQIFDHQLQYIVTDVTRNGFVIQLDQPAPVDVAFSWMAVAVKSPKTFIGDQPSQLQRPTPFPTVVPSPTLLLESLTSPVPTVSPSPLPLPSPSPSPFPTISPSPEASPSDVVGTPE